MIRYVLVLAGAGAVALAQLPALRRGGQTGEFWAVLTLLVLTTGIGLIAVSDLPLPSLARLLIDVVQPFGRFLVGE